MNKSRNPFLFRGPIPTCGAEDPAEYRRRNPFLFRGPIPTRSGLSAHYLMSQSQSLLIKRSYSYKIEKLSLILFHYVAIPSY